MIRTDLNFRVGRRGRRRSAGPVSLSLFGLILTAMTVIFLFVSFHVRAEGERSAYTQAHGAIRQASILTVQNIQHQSHSQHGGTSTWYTAQMSVSLTQPVRGLSQTTVEVPHAVSYTAGEAVTVLVDPAEPGYAELPGTPDVTAKDWWGSIAGAAIAALIACVLYWQAFKKIRARRQAMY